MKKLIALLLVVVLTATVSIAGTTAYLQSEDSDVNVMTLGNVKIDQIEQERDEAGNLVNFTQAKPAYPAVGPVEWAGTGVNVNGTEYKVFTDELKNVVDKIVTVENTGKSPAYVRTVIAIEAPDYDPNDLIHINYNDTGVSISEPVKVEVGGVEYVCFAFTYDAALAPGQTSAPSLMQVFLDSKATNEDVAKFGDTWEILVVSQAVQTQGFADATAALNAGFGEMNKENIPMWFSEMEKPVIVSSVQELKDAMLIRDAHIVLADDIVVDANTPLQWSKYMFVANGREVTIDLNGKSIIVEEDASLGTNGLFTTANKGMLNIVGEGTVKIQNGKSGVFHAMNAGDQINVYGGTYISNSDNGSDALAIIYTNSGNVDVYGGKFCPLEGVPSANAEDKQGSRLSVVFHEGTLFKHEVVQRGDSTRIHLEEGCELQEVTINGETWYKVVKG